MPFEEHVEGLSRVGANCLQTHPDPLWLYMDQDARDGSQQQSLLSKTVSERRSNS